MNSSMDMDGISDGSSVGPGIVLENLPSLPDSVEMTVQDEVSNLHQPQLHVKAVHWANKTLQGTISLDINNRARWTTGSILRSSSTGSAGGIGGVETESLI